ncbi:hypothetical protein PHYBOEH_006330 [Phytophthora boehmeriae]|uniref:Jacalin-type lectin domain-containing protein n=1 Tax=Phytophthora boehmeriae TaxID=109152 RepID=A0A8T1WKP9_9STRA|nr:hypothetical protein PHYBOEH_006330 [Phytophthora boehmeriae]
MYVQYKDSDDHSHQSSCVRRTWTSLFASCFAKATERCTIKVKNLSEEEAVHHPLVLLEGTVTGLQGIRQNDVFLDTQVDGENALSWPVGTTSGRFKAFVLLPRPGKFNITLQIIGVCARVFHVEYAPPCATPYIVKFHYLKHSDEGSDTPPDTEGSNTAAIQKIRFNALILQMVVAEMMNAAGLPRRTFALQFAADGLPEVSSLQSCSMKTSSAQEDEDISEVVGLEIESTGLDSPAEMEVTHIVVVEGSRFSTENNLTKDDDTENDDESKQLNFFFARGLDSWPSQLSEITASCLNSFQRDGGALQNIFVSDIGEFLQVLGRTFDESISTNNFTHMNELLCVYEADSHVEVAAFGVTNSQGWFKLDHTAIRELKCSRGPIWDGTSAKKLCDSPWIWSPGSVRMYGPVGTIQDDDDDQEVLGELSTSRNAEFVNELHAVAMNVDTMLDEFWSISRKSFSEMENNDEVCAQGKKHWFILVDGEYITRVDICASTWIKGLQFHTNLRTSRWYGSTGGQKQVLECPEGWRVATFFGSKSGEHVRTLGVKCLPLSSLPQPRSTWPKPRPQTGSSVKFLEAVGDALEHGPNTRFLLLPDTIGAVVIRCGDYVETPFRVLSPKEAAANCSNPVAYSYNDHVFELVPGEKIVKVEMSSGHWVDLVRLTTTLRVSPWFGGWAGTARPALECPTGHSVCGFYGTHGKKFVGALGILHCAD